MDRQFPLNRGSHPQPPLYPNGSSGAGYSGALAGSIAVGVTTGANTPIVVKCEDSQPAGSTVSVTLTAIGCAFSDSSTSKAQDIVSGTGTLSVTVVRPPQHAGQGVVLAHFTATGRVASYAAIDIPPQSLPDPGADGAVLASDATTGAWKRTDALTVRQLTVTQAFGCNGATPQTAITLPAAATDAASTQALANALRSLAISFGLGA